MRLTRSIFVFALVAVCCLPARADIGLLLNAKPNEHIEIGFAEITGEGHSAVYLSRVCPESPVKMRLCHSGEFGSILQNYVDYKEDEPYQWNIVPLNVYLYGVDDLRDRPLFASPDIRAALQERYRRLHMQAVCTTETCINAPDANWRDAVAAAFVREIYMFVVSTSVEQDEEFIREFNARANVNHYNGFSRNCADFAKMVVNTYFPHSAHRDPINDFGMTGPKAIARSFTHYAEHHPALQLRVVRIDQVPGTYKRSSDCKEGTEQTFRSVKWLVPMVFIEAHAVPVLAASYLLTGRFDPNHELRNHPSTEAASLQEQLSDAKQTKDKTRARALKKELKAERESQVGTEQQWQQYRDRFDEVLRSAIADGVFTDRREVRTLFRNLQAHGRIYLDQHQQPWLEVTEDGQVRRVGLSAENIFESGSDHQLALQVLLARTNALLAVNAKHRELMPDFQNDWALLRTAQDTKLLPGDDRAVASRANSE